MRLIDVVTPFTASGQVSAEGLERLVRWVRRLPADGVLVWSALGSGGDLDVEELEEIYATWRAGLPPDRIIYAMCPPGRRADYSAAVNFERQVYLAAVRARSIGADGLILQSEIAAETERNVATLELPVQRWTSGISSEGKEKSTGQGIEVLALAIPNFEFAKLKIAEDSAPLMLQALALRNIIPANAAFTRHPGEAGSQAEAAKIASLLPADG